MIVSDRHRFVYIAIPKTGSLSIARWLTDHYAGSPLGYHHEWRVPPAYQDYDVFTVVRDPYERCLSAWWFRCQEPSRREGNPTFGWSFPTFMRSVLAYRQRGASLPATGTEASMTQVAFVELSQAASAVRLEQPEEFASLPFVGKTMPPLPHVNKNSQRARQLFDSTMTTESEQLVWDYCADDFAAFGYSRRRPSGSSVSH